MKKHVLLTSLVAMGLSCGAHAASTDVTFAGTYTTADGKTANLTDEVGPATYEYTVFKGTEGTEPKTGNALDEAPDKSLFSYIGADGKNASLADLTDENMPQIEDYNDVSAADGDTVRTTQKIVAGETAELGNYEYKNANGDYVTLGDAAPDFTETVTLANGTEITVKNGDAPEFNGTQYAVVLDNGTEYTLTEDGTGLIDKNGVLVSKDNINPGSELETKFGAAKDAFESDKSAVEELKTSTGEAFSAENALYSAAKAIFDTDDKRIKELTTNFNSIEAAQTAFAKAEQNQQNAQIAKETNDALYLAADTLFNAPIEKTITDGANNAIEASLEEGGVLNTALAEKASVEDVEVNTTAIAANKTAIESEVARATAAEEALSSRIDVNAGDIAANKTAIETNATNIAANKQAIATETAERKAADEQLAKDIKAGDEMTLAAAKAYADIKNEAALKSANDYTDTKVKALEKDMSAGIAAATAVSSIAVSNVAKGEVSVGGGYGYYNSQSAVAFGAAMGLTDNWSINAAAGLADSNVSFRAGTNYKFKLF